MGEAIMAFATGGPLLSVVQELTGCRRIEPRGRSPLDWRSRCQRHGGGQAHQDWFDMVWYPGGFRRRMVQLFTDQRRSEWRRSGTRHACFDIL